MENNRFLVPLSIIVSGALVAAAIYFGDGSKAATFSNPSTPAPKLGISGVTASDHILGSSEAPIVVVEYSDTECPFCKVFHSTMKQVVDSYGGRVAWVFRHYPVVQLHTRAYKEAEALECAAELGGNIGFWKYLDAVFERTNSNDSLDPAELPRIAGAIGLDTSAFNTCLSSGRHKDVIDGHIKEAVTNGGRGTPYSILLLNGIKISSSQKSEFANLLTQRRLNPAGVTVSDDGTRVALNGALPLDLMREIINVILN